MTRRKNENESIRKVFKFSSGSMGITIPISLFREMGWREKQKLVIKKRGKGVVITDWDEDISI